MSVVGIVVTSSVVKLVETDGVLTNICCLSLQVREPKHLHHGEPNGNQTTRLVFLQDVSCVVGPSVCPGMQLRLRYIW